MADDLILTHPNINLSAPIQYWRALSAVCPSHKVQRHYHGGLSAQAGDTEWEVYVDVHGGGTEALLLLGVARSMGIDNPDPDGRAPIIWVLGEVQRRAEERQRVEAITREAEAVTALAAAIRAGGDGAVLARLMPRLTGDLQREVRAQLGDAWATEPF